MNLIETDRLALRQLQETDAPFIFELLNTPSWLEFIGNSNIQTLQDAQQYIQRSALKSYETNGFGLWLTQLKSDNTPIGICGLVKRPTLTSEDIGFAFLPNYEGKGYAYEAAMATLHYAQYTLQLPQILAITVATNVKSIRLLEKIGLQFDTFIVHSNGEELMLFAKKW